MVQEDEDRGLLGSKKVRMEEEPLVLEHNLKRTIFRRVVEEI